MIRSSSKAQDTTPGGRDAEELEDEYPTYRTLINEGDDASFHALLGRWGHPRAVVSVLWKQVRIQAFGQARLPRPVVPETAEFVSNDTRASRCPIGNMIVQWRRLPNDPHLIDLEVVNVTPEE
jgi:hypothetical protein